MALSGGVKWTMREHSTSSASARAPGHSHGLKKGRAIEKAKTAPFCCRVNDSTGKEDHP